MERKGRELKGEKGLVSGEEVDIWLDEMFLERAQLHLNTAQSSRSVYQERKYHVRDGT